MVHMITPSYFNSYYFLATPNSRPIHKCSAKFQSSTKTVLKSVMNHVYPECSMCPLQSPVVTVANNMAKNALGDNVISKSSRFSFIIDFT